MPLSVLLLVGLFIFVVIPFKVAAYKRRFTPAVVSTVFNGLLFAGMFSGWVSGWEFLASVLLMFIVTGVAVLYTMTRSTPPGSKTPAPTPSPTRTPSLAEGEKVVLSRTYAHFLAYVLVFSGIAVAFIGAILLLEGSRAMVKMGFLILFLGLVVWAIGYAMINVWTFTLIVTNKRVIVQSAFNSRKSLPINHISAVGTAIFGTLYVGSSAGRIILSFVPGCAEVYDTINALLSKVE